MPWAFMGIETMRRSLYAIQRSIETASHNIANASTKGFSRQEVTSVPTDPYAWPSMQNEQGAMQLGTGVRVQSITRIRDTYIDGQVHLASASYGRLDQLRTTLTQAQAVFNEPADAALSDAFSSFWNAWQDVASKPDNMASRSVLSTQTDEMVRQVREAFQRLQDLKTDANAKITSRVDEINSIAPELASLNTQIRQVRNLGFEPNDMLDERDRLLDRLSQLTNYQQTQMADGTMTVSIGSLLLVSQQYSAKLTDTSAITGGEIGGLKESLDSIQSVSDKFNDMVSQMITQVNTLHKRGFDLDGNAGVDFFTGTDASSIATNPAITNDLKLIAAGSAAGVSGDGEIAGQIADLRRALTMTGGTISFDDYYNSFISSLGVQIQSNTAAANTQSVIVDQVESQRDSVSGVSLDEEMTNMLQFQRSYEASARCMTMIDEMMQTLINKVGTGT